MPPHHLSHFSLDNAWDNDPGAEAWDSRRKAKNAKPTTYSGEVNGWGEPVDSSANTDGVELDGWGMPIDPNAKPTHDEWGQPLEPEPEEKKVKVELDGWGQPIDPNAPKPEDDPYGGWGAAVVEGVAANAAVFTEEWEAANPLPPDDAPRKKGKGWNGKVTKPRGGKGGKGGGGAGGDRGERKAARGKRAEPELWPVTNDSTSNETDWAKAPAEPDPNEPVWGAQAEDPGW